MEQIAASPVHRVGNVQCGPHSRQLDRPTIDYTTEIEAARSRVSAAAEFRAAWVGIDSCDG
jgi:hypothetical protein